MVLDTLIWLAAVELIGLLAFPLAFTALPWLPDRGYSVAKGLGLILVFYPLWLLGTTQVIPNSLFTIAFILVALGLVSLLILWLHQNQMAAFLSREWRVLLLTEAVFLGVFAVWVYVRAHDPAINHTEQPMDFAFLNAALTSTSFPPRDPWLAGEPVSYYYFGYLIMGGLTRLTAISSSVSYNLALALIPALAAMGVFGVGANMVRLAGGGTRAALASGLAAAVLLLGVANLESGLEFLRSSGVRSSGFWEWVSIKGLDGPSVSTEWYPTEPGWWWWRATRVIDTVQGGTSLDYTITEFPFFSFLLGDLHPHVMSLPFIILFTALVLNLFVAPVVLGGRWLWDNMGLALLLALSLGALGFINLWDLPTFSALFAAAALAVGYRQRGTVKGAFAAALPAVVVVVVLAVALYLPFYGTFNTSASAILPVEEYVSRYFHFGIIWGLFLLVLLPFLLWQLVAFLRSRPWGRREALLALGIPLVPFLVWALVESILTWDLSQMPGLLGGRLVHLLPWLGMMAVSLYLLLRRERGGERGGGTFALLLVAVGFLLLMGPELFHVVDLFNNRMNTIFKLYYQAWMFLALASSYALYYLGVRLVRSGVLGRIAGYSWLALLTIALAVTLYYSAASVYTKALGQGGEVTLNGLAYVRAQNDDEFQAILWLKENFSPEARIIEGVGNDYVAESSRVSASTGLPTVLGWPGHEHQWRGSTKLFKGREDEVRTVYQSTDLERAEEILRRYGVTYIYVGPRERATYGTAGLEKFDQFLERVFPTDDSTGEQVTIYRFRG